jgi:hypothetical protein
MSKVDELLTFPKVPAKQPYKVKISSGVVYDGVSVFLPLATSLITYYVINPLLDDNALLKDCTKRGELNRSSKSFLWTSTIATFGSIALLLIRYLMINFGLPKAFKGDAVKMKTWTRRMNYGSIGLKAALFVSAVVSGSVAAAAYAKCKKQADDKKAIEAVATKT